MEGGTGGAFALIVALAERQAQARGSAVTSLDLLVAASSTWVTMLDLRNHLWSRHSLQPDHLQPALELYGAREAVRTDRGEIVSRILDGAQARWAALCMTDGSPSRVDPSLLVMLAIVEAGENAALKTLSGDAVVFLRKVGDQLASSAEVARIVEEDVEPETETNALDRFTAAVDAGVDGPVGRSQEILDLLVLLGGRGRGHRPIVIEGERGVGKSSVVRGLQAALQSANLPPGWPRWRLLEVTDAIRDTGPLRRPLDDIFEEAARAGDVVVVVPDLMETISRRNDGWALRDAMVAERFPIIAECEPVQLQRYLDMDPALATAVHRLQIAELPSELVRQVVESRVSVVGTEKGVVYPHRLSGTASAFGGRYMRNRSEPGRSIEILKLAGTRALLRHHAPGGVTDPEGQVEVTVSDVSYAVAVLSRIPAARMAAGDTQRLISMEHDLALRIAGHSETIADIADAVRRSRAGLSNIRRPIGTFILKGPPGVGKTAIAIALAEFLFGDEHAVMRFDMSEYNEQYSISRLIGAPPGYVAHDSGGQLTEAVRRRGYGVILLDEIDRAAAEVRDLFLQVFDDGRLTDGAGNTVDFRNTVIIMTTNAEGPSVHPFGFVSPEHSGDIQGDVRDELFRTGIFNAAFLDRVDGVHGLSPLDARLLPGIVRIELARRTRRLIEQSSIGLHVTDAAVGEIVRLGFRPDVGGRPLHRALDCVLGDRRLAGSLLTGRLAENDVVVVDHAPSGGFTYSRAAGRLGGPIPGVQSLESLSAPVPETAGAALGG